MSACTHTGHFISFQLFKKIKYGVHIWSQMLFLQGVADLEREEEDGMEDSGEVLDDSSSSPSSTLKNYPLTCKVLYSYKVRGAVRTGAETLLITFPGAKLHLCS